MMSLVLFLSQTVIVWNGDSCKEIEGLRAEVGNVVADSVEFLVKVLPQGHRVFVGKDLRFIFVSHEKSNATKLEQKLYDAANWLDQTLSAPSGNRLDVAGKPLSRSPIVLCSLKHHADYISLLDALADDSEYVSWARSSLAAKTGFVISKPFFGAWYEPRDSKYREENEALNRLGRLWTFREFEQLPHWMEVGFGWVTELTWTDSVWSFPHRDGFTWDREHSGFTSRLKRLFRRNEVHPPVPPLFSKTTYDRDTAAVAWGLCDFLIREPTAGAYLEDLRLARHEGRQGDSKSWTMNPNYEPPLEKQRSLLEKHGIDLYDFIAEASGAKRRK